MVHNTVVQEGGRSAEGWRLEEEAKIEIKGMKEGIKLKILLKEEIFLKLHDFVIQFF
jgi:hypothetical protein